MAGCAGPTVLCPGHVYQVHQVIRSLIARVLSMKTFSKLCSGCHALSAAISLLHALCKLRVRQLIEAVLDVPGHGLDSLQRPAGLLASTL